jgi:hypothetical protein
MPTVLERGYRFFFYADDRTELRHVHVYRLIAQHRELLLQKWHDFFSD